MKFCKRYLLVPVLCLATVFAAGCKSKPHEIYTNIPEGGYSVDDKTFALSPVIEGYTPSVKEETQTDTTGFTSRRYTFYAMTVNADLVISDDFTKEGAEEKASGFTAAIAAKLLEVEKAISGTVMSSDVYRFNNAAAGERLEIKQITYEVLSEALAVHSFTDGYYNPALYYNIQAYGFGGAYNYPENKEGLPADDMVAKYTDLASHFSDLTLEEEEGKYYLTKPAYTVEADGETLSMKLDLGGIGKGYAVDLIDKMFDDYGYEFGYFNFGTSSMTIKSHVANGDYNIGLSSPRSPSRDPFMTVPLRNEKLSTSGDNEQRYFIDGVRYCHVISPVTGKPVQTGIMSATVMGGGAAEADALTTAIMAMEKEDAISFIAEKLTDKKVVITVE